MATMTAALYLADRVEPGRSYTGVEELRETLRRDAFQAIKDALRSQIEHALRRGLPLHLATVHAYNGSVLEP